MPEHPALKGIVAVAPIITAALIDDHDLARRLAEQCEDPEADLVRMAYFVSGMVEAIAEDEGRLPSEAWARFLLAVHDG